MGYDYQTSRQQTQCHETLFPVSKTVILERNARTFKHLLSILEAKAMFGNVPLVLRVIPFLDHFRFSQL